MRIFAERLYNALENQLNEVSLNGEPLTAQYKSSITLCKKAMAKLKNYISGTSFTSKEDEIHFFKYLKPRFYSKYINFINVYNFVMKRPLGGEEIVKEYIQDELADIKRFFDHNQAFYQYYRSGATQMDELYFVRGGFNVHIELDDFEEDELYSTSHDYKLSKIMANEMYLDFLNQELQKVLHQESPVMSESLTDSGLEWTASKTDLVELSYALISMRVFNSGNAEIKTVVSVLESTFHVNLGSYYHKYLDINRRKKDRTSFLDKLKFALLVRMDEKLDN